MWKIRLLVVLVIYAFFNPVFGFVSFKQACNATYYEKHLNDSRSGLVDANGNPVQDIKLAAGIDIEKCYEVCGTGYQDFYYLGFASSFTTWLLPWLTLIAQLPYEASDIFANIMSILLALGSPALVTYSVTLTIMNGYSIRQRFKEIRDQCQNFQWAEDFKRRTMAAAFIVQQSQQVPMRASEDNGWLSSLVVLQENQAWWERTKRHLRNTRRGKTFSLYAQIAMAGIAWLLTVIGALIGNIGDTTTALQFSSGSLWLWMIPVILGWIMVGTQSSSTAISNALSHEATRIGSQPGMNGATYITGEQKGIQNRKGLSTRPAANAEPNGPGMALQPVGPGVSHRQSFPDRPVNEDFTWLGSSLSGDEVQAGPTYIYARQFTWWAFAETVEDAFRTAEGNLERNVAVGLHGQQQLGEARMNVAQFCGLRRGTRRVYLDWRDIPSAAWRHMFYAALTAVFLQWGVTGASLMTAYLTPTVGLGCRSGAYLLYGSVATFSWLLLVVSSLLSHSTMLCFQRRVEHPLDNLPVARLLRVSTLLTRKFGKSLAVLNGIFIFVSCIFEYAGFYSRCWCQANVLSMGSRAYSVIFLTANDQARAAQKYWGGGIAFLVIVATSTWMLFSLYCKGNPNADD